MVRVVEVAVPVVAVPVRAVAAAVVCVRLLKRALASHMSSSRQEPGYNPGLFSCLYCNFMV